MTRRDFTRVVYEILRLSENGISKSQMVYQANLNFRLAKRYTDFLIRTDMLQSCSKTNGHEFYELTVKGKRVLHLLGDVQHEFAFPRPRPRLLSGTLPYQAFRVKSIGKSEDGETAGEWSVGNPFRTRKSILTYVAGFLASLLAGIGLGYIIP
jgi:predicted transcriptional regulator